MERLETVGCGARRITQAAICNKDTSGQQSQAEDTKQNGSPEGASSCTQHLTKSHREAECQQPTHEKVHDLLPALIAGAERTHIVVPRTIAWPRGSLDQKNNDE